MHRFYVPPDHYDGDEVIFPEAAAHQIRVVLRMTKGQRVLIFDNQGSEAEVEISDVAKQQVKGKTLRVYPKRSPLRVRLTLYLSLLKKENFEWVLQKGTEIGVARFVPMICQRTIVDRVSDHKVQRWDRILIEAAEQSGRVDLPFLEPITAFDDAILQAGYYVKMLIAWEKEEQLSLRAALSGLKSEAELALAVMIGAEGGFSEGEIAQARARGIIPVSLGQTILRAETAAVVTAANVLYELNI